MSAKNLVSIEDWLNLNADSHAELIDGQIVYKTHPDGEHGDRQGAVISALRTIFNRKPQGNGTGGWWIMSDVSILYTKLERILEPDIVGWKRNRVPEKPTGYPIAVRPDWVCEVSHTTWKKDTTTVYETLEAAGVPYYWLLDVERENLVVFELQETGKYARIHSFFRENGKVRIKPFDAVELEMGILLGDDPE